MGVPNDFGRFRVLPPSRQRDHYTLPTYLYRLYDERNRLLYIGVTGDADASRRVKSHRRRQSWGADIAHWTVGDKPFPDRPTAHRAEGDAIKREKPLHNVIRFPN